MILKKRQKWQANYWKRFSGFALLPMDLQWGWRHYPGSLKWLQLFYNRILLWKWNTVLKYCRYRVIGGSFLHVIFKHLPCQLKGLGRWLNTGLRLYLKENVAQAASQLQGKHIIEEQLITCHPRTQRSWGNLNQKNGIYRVQRLFPTCFSRLKYCAV